MSYDEALRTLAADPAYAQLMADIYVDGDVREAARRFLASAEWDETLRLIGDRIPGSVVLDVGAGSGVASWALAVGGAGEVFALEPESSALGGRVAIETLGDARIKIIDGVGEAIPLPDGAIDIVYARQVLHHADDLDAMLVEFARVLRPGGILFACREVVADDAAQLEAFLAAHPVHQLAGGEHAFPLRAYRSAITNAGLRLVSVLGPWDSLINIFPLARSREELAALPAVALGRRLGRAGTLAARVPGVAAAIRLRWRWLSRDYPGRLYSFVATKP